MSYPTEIIELPSKGIFYNEDNPLSKGTIELFLPTAKHEDILTSKNLINKGIVIDELLKSLIVNKNIDYNTLLSIDKSALIIAARILLYSNEYSPTTKCPSCDASQIHKIDLHDIDVSDFDESEFEKGVNEFKFTLPKSKTNIKFKLLTIEDELKIASQLKVIKKNFNGAEPEVTTRLSFIITEWEGERSQAKIKKLISDNLLTNDSLAFREYMKNTFPHLNEDVVFECNICGHSEVRPLPLDISFFWPSSRG